MIMKDNQNKVVNKNSESCKGIYIWVRAPQKADDKIYEYLSECKF